jgi:hypothetical protein
MGNENPYKREPQSSNFEGKLAKTLAFAPLATTRLTLNQAIEVPKEDQSQPPDAETELRERRGKLTTQLKDHGPAPLSRALSGDRHQPRSRG